MTNAEMNARVRSLLDELKVGFYDNNKDIYPALDNGQKQYASIILAQFKARQILDPSIEIPQTLYPLYATVTNNLSSGLSYFPLPEDYADDIGLKITADSVDYVLYKRPISKAIFHKQVNTYLNEANSYYNIDTANVNIEFYGIIPTLTYYTFGYLKKVTDLTSSVEPILPNFTHPAICIYAVSELLVKKRFHREAQLAYQQFLTMVQYQ